MFGGILQAKNVESGESAIIHNEFVFRTQTGQVRLTMLIRAKIWSCRRGTDNLTARGSEVTLIKYSSCSELVLRNLTTDNLKTTLIG